MTYQENLETQKEYRKRRYQVNPEVHKNVKDRYQEKKKDVTRFKFPFSR